MNGLREVVGSPGSRKSLFEVSSQSTGRPPAAWLWVFHQAHLTAQVQLQVQSGELAGFKQDQVVLGKQASSDVPLAPILIVFTWITIIASHWPPDSSASSILLLEGDSKKTHYWPPSLPCITSLLHIDFLFTSEMDPLHLNPCLRVSFSGDSTQTFSNQVMPTILGNALVTSVGPGLHHSLGVI